MSQPCGLPHRRESAAGDRRRLAVVLGITAAYMVAEVIGGLWANSLALLSDAGHMLTDVAALALALFALWFGARPAPPQKTYGYYRLEILAALFNGMALLALTGFIIYAAIRRMSAPPDVRGLGLLLVAMGGLIVNAVCAGILYRGHGRTLNVRAAFFHILADALGSVGALTAGVLIVAFGWRIADSVCAIGIALLILFGAVALVREATDVLLEASPKHIAVEGVSAAISAVPGVQEVHDLHVWAITSGMYALSAHVMLAPDEFAVAKLEEIRIMLHDHCGIAHQTIQLETREFAAEEETHL